MDNWSVKVSDVLNMIKWSPRTMGEVGRVAVAGMHLKVVAVLRLTTIAQHIIVFAVTICWYRLTMPHASLAP